MSGITYTANDRAPLITASPAHIAGNDYSIDLKLTAYTTTIETPQTQTIALNSASETVLQRASDAMSASFVWPDSENDDVQEFLYSIAGGEVFDFDPYGTIAVPDASIEVVYGGDAMSVTRLTHGKVHYRAVSLKLRPNV